MQPLNTIEHIVPKEEVQYSKCASCQYSIPIYIMKDAVPHLYCTSCSNVYHERHEIDYKNQFRFTPFRLKVMRYIEGHAPPCECGGMFLFNTPPRCPRCHDIFAVSTEMNTRKRLTVDEMILFNGSTEFVDHGQNRRYEFAINPHAQ